MAEIKVHRPNIKMILGITENQTLGRWVRCASATSVLYCLPKIKQLRTNHYISGDEELVVEVEFLLLGVRGEVHDGPASGVEAAVGQRQDGLMELPVGQKVGHVRIFKGQNQNLTY